MSDCALCAAIHETRVVRENDHAFAVICMWPLKRHHVLVIPKRHVTQEELAKLSDAELRDFTDLLSWCRDRVREVSGGGGEVLVAQNSGSNSTQPHLHYHVIPVTGSVRDLVSALEGVPRHPRVPDEEMVKWARELGS